MAEVDGTGWMTSAGQSAKGGKQQGRAADGLPRGVRANSILAGG